MKWLLASNRHSNKKALFVASISILFLMTEVNSTQGNYFGRISDTQYLRRSKKKRCRPLQRFSLPKPGEVFVKQL